MLSLFTEGGKPSSTDQSPAVLTANFNDWMGSEESPCFSPLLRGGTLVSLLTMVILISWTTKQMTLPSAASGENLLTCAISKESIFFNEGEKIWSEDHILCSPVYLKNVQDESYRISLPNDLKEKYEEEIELNMLILAIRNGSIQRDAVADFGQDEIVDIQVREDDMNLGNRELINGFETRSLMLLRVSTKDSIPFYTADELRDRTFGYDKVTLQSQYDACSGGALKFVEPAGFGKHGVLEVPLDSMVSDFKSHTDMMNHALEFAAGLLKIGEGAHISELADHILICLPPGTGTWVGSASTNHWRSVYNDKFCGMLSVTMHEIGHNLGLAHANENGSYLDYTSYMSAGHARERFPQKCFNAQNHFHLGWFGDRTLSLWNVTEPVSLSLASFVDYRRLEPLSPVMVLVVIDERYFIQFNRAKEFNRETEEKIDQVTVVEKVGGGTEMLAGLGLRSGFKIHDYRNGKTLTITVCDMTTIGDQLIDLVSLEVSSSGHSESCDKSARAALPQTSGIRYTSEPSTLATQSPSKAPSVHPSMYLSQLPSSPPSAKPSSKLLDSPGDLSISPTGLPLPLSMGPSPLGSLPSLVSSQYQYSFGVSLSRLSRNKNKNEVHVLDELTRRLPPLDSPVDVVFNLTQFHQLGSYYFPDYMSNHLTETFVDGGNRANMQKDNVFTSGMRGRSSEADAVMRIKCLGL